MDDKTALEDMRKGGEVGFETLHRYYLPRLKAHLCKKYSYVTSDIADEICQEVFFNFYRNIHTFEEKSVNNVMGWLFTAAKNKTIDYWRKAGNLQLESFEEEEFPVEFDEQEEKRFCYAECIGNALKRLGTDDTDCLTALIFSFPKSSIDKIANEMGMTHKAAKVLLNRCKRKFKENPNCLMALMLFYALEWSQKEMAEILDKKENTIGVFLSNCRKKLKNDTNFKNCYAECID